jgi:hypothetical protein
MRFETVSRPPAVCRAALVTAASPLGTTLEHESHAVAPGADLT